MSRRSHLTTQLARYEPVGEMDVEYKRRMIDLLALSDDPFARDRTRPGHFTASAFVLSPDRKALLLVHHRTLGLWLQPGGHIEPHDGNLLAAARRELHEETGVLDPLVESEAIFDIDIHQIPANRLPTHLHFDVRFLFCAKTSFIVAGSDASDVRWTPLDNVGEHDSDASVMRAVTRMRRPSARSASQQNRPMR